MMERSENSSSDPAVTLRSEWQRGVPSPARIRELLASAPNDALRCELLTIDAEERWARGLSGGLEHYLDSVPAVSAIEGAVQSLLLAEILRQPEVERSALRVAMATKYPSLVDEIELALDLFEAMGEPCAGQVLDQYRLERPLGQGSFAVVWLAYDSKLDRRIALKLLHPRDGVAQDDAVGALSEAQAAARLRHPSIVTIHAAGQFEGTGRHYIDCEVIGDAAPTPSDPRAIAVGTPMSKLGSEPGKPAVSPRRACALVREVTAAMVVAHAHGIVHRDLKPANIVVTPSGRPVVTDFGFSLLKRGDGGLDGLEPSAESSRARTISGGTPAFMAPEQARGESATPLTDVFCLGSTLYYLLAGRSPYDLKGGLTAVLEQARAARIAPLPSGVPGRLRAIVGKAMAHEPEDRYASASAFEGDLAAFLEQRPTSHDGLGLGPQLFWLLRRRPKTMVGATLVVAAILGFLWLWSGERARRNSLEEELEAESLIDRADSFWPRNAQALPALQHWIERSDALLSRMDERKPVWARLRAVQPIVRDHEVVTRRVLSQSPTAWQECLREVAGDAELGRYLRTPLRGLEPLGRHPVSGHWEFWHIETGERPAWPETSDPARGALPESSALVMVLIPGGDVVLAGEALRLPPFLVAKYELTQGQYFRLTRESPSQFRPASGGPSSGRAHPVERIPLGRARSVAARIEMSLPTWAQWRRICGTAEAREGAASLGLPLPANLKDEAWRREYRRTDLVEPFDDGWPQHAPVGSFPPNGSGLYDLFGNIYEWIEDAPLMTRPGIPESEIRRSGFAMGGSFATSADYSGRAQGARLHPDDPNHELGFRPVLNLFSN